MIFANCMWKYVKCDELIIAIRSCIINYLVISRIIHKLLNESCLKDEQSHVT